MADEGAVTDPLRGRDAPELGHFVEPAGIGRAHIHKVKPGFAALDHRDSGGVQPVVGDIELDSFDPHLGTVGQAEVVREIIDEMALLGMSTVVITIVDASSSAPSAPTHEMSSCVERK